MMDKMAENVLPAAELRHSTPGRLRLKFPEKIGDRQWFADIGKTLIDEGGFTDVVANPSTGSILLRGEKAEPSTIASLGGELKLFDFNYKPDEKAPISKKAAEPISSFNRKLEEFTNGELNLPTVIFTALLLNGFYQVLRGRVGPLPWYSALWYAFGLYSKKLES